MTFELFITRRYFKSKPKQTIIALITLLSMIGVAIGVTALIVVIGVMAGFESDLKARIMGIEPHLVIDRNGQPIVNYEHVVDLARQSPGVTSAWPVVELQVMLRADSRAAGALIKGVEPRAALKGLGIPTLTALQPKDSDSDTLPPSANTAPMVIGRDLARNLGLIKGDTLFAVSPRGTLAPVGYVPYMKRFVVADFFETGMYEYDGSLAFVNIKDAQALDRIKGSATAVEIRIQQIFQTQMIKERLLSSLDSSFRARDWIQLNKNLFSALKLEKAAMFITLTLIILVATFSITSSLVMLVMEKTKDIAVLRALGASGRAIKRIFVIQGLMIGSLGTIAGVIFGTVLCYLQTTYKLIRLPGDVYYITALPVDLEFNDVALVALSALVICFLATLYPAQQAARLNPVEAIRYG
jgi:lipoprotein-releasing system permease protein